MPVGGLGVEHRVEGKLGKTGFDVSSGSSTVAGQYVAPVALGVDEQLLLAQLHQRVAYRHVAVGVQLHRLAHHVGHLIISAVVHALHGVQYASLHRLQTVLDMRHGTFQDYVAGVIQKPVLVHSRKVMHGRSVETVGGAIVGVLVVVQYIVCFLFGLVVVHSYYRLLQKVYKIRSFF